MLKLHCMGGLPILLLQRLNRKNLLELMNIINLLKCITNMNVKKMFQSDHGLNLIWWSRFFPLFLVCLIKI